MTQFSNAPTPAQRDARIEQLNDSCFALLAKIYDRWFKLSDTWLNQAAQQQSDPKVQQYYFAARQCLHRHRHRLQDAWRQHIRQELSQFWQQEFTVKQLAEWQNHPWHTTLERIINTIEARSPARLNQILQGLNRYQRRQQSLPQLPFAPTRLVTGFARLLVSVALPDDVHIPLLGKWESALQADLSDTLSNVQQFLNNEQHLSRATQTSVVAGVNQLRLSNLQALLSLRGSRPAPLGSTNAGHQPTQTLARQALLNCIDRFQIVQLDAHAGDPVLSTTLSIQDFRFWLQQELTAQEAELGPQQLSRADDDLCNLTEMFIAGLECPQLPQPVRSLLLRLQTLILKALLLDQSFFYDPQHAVRQYLDTVGHFALGWKPGASITNDPLLNILQQSVTRLLTGCQRDTECFALIARWVAQSLSGDEQRRQRLAQHALNSEIGRTRLARGQQFIDAALAERIADSVLPAIGEILTEGPWRHALLQILIKQGCHSAAWETALVTTDQLIGSLQEPTLTETLTNTERPAWINRLPGMVRRLCSELDASQCSQQRIGKITQALWQYHAERFQLSAADLRDVPRDEQPQPVNPEWVASTLHDSRQRFTLLEIDLLSEFTNGAWVLLEKDKNQHFAQLAGYIPETASYLFVNYDGKKCAHLTRTQISNLKKQARFHALKPVPLSEHALRHLVANLEAPTHSSVSPTSSSSIEAGASGASSRDSSTTPKLRSDANAPTPQRTSMNINQVFAGLQHLMK